MNIDWTSLLPFLAALQRQPGTPSPDGDSDSPEDESDGGRAVLSPSQKNGGAAALSQSNLIGSTAPSMAQSPDPQPGANQGQQPAQPSQSGPQGSNPNQRQQAQPQPTPPAPTKEDSSHPGVEVLTFDPVGYGRSSFGHQAISVDGTTYSFGETGTWHEEGTDSYLKNRNSFRNGVGQVLDLTKEEAAAIVDRIKADEGVKQKWGPSNNCTTKVRDMLEQATHKPF